MHFPFNKSINKVILKTFFLLKPQKFLAENRRISDNLYGSQQPLIHGMHPTQHPHKFLGRSSTTALLNGSSTTMPKYPSVLNVCFCLGLSFNVNLNYFSGNNNRANNLPPSITRSTQRLYIKNSKRTSNPVPVLWKVSLLLGIQTMTHFHF